MLQNIFSNRNIYSVGVAKFRGNLAHQRVTRLSQAHQLDSQDNDVAEPLSEAFIQISRYANTRDDEYGVKEGEEKLFHPNLFSIITHGTEARFGTITGEFDHYLNWKDIFPEVYRDGSG